MSRRSIGQEYLAFSRCDKNTQVDALSELVNWSEIDHHLRPISASPKGEAGWPPLALFKACLLAIWYNLSDVKLAEALDDCASFRRFCGFGSSEPTPERTAFVRFRKALIEHNLMERLFETVTAQLKAQHIQVKTGTIIDATIIASHSKRDRQARFIKHQGKPAVHGYKAHVACDQQTALIDKVRVTPANVNDGKAGCDIVPYEPGDVYADSAYRGGRFKEAVSSQGGVARVVCLGVYAFSDEEACRILKRINTPIHRVRCRIEKIFGLWKRSYGLRRLELIGQAKADFKIRLAAIAYNIKQSQSLTAIAI